VGKTKKNIDFEGVMELSDTINYVEKILDGLRAGTVCVQRGGEQLAVHPEGIVHVELEAKAKDDKESLELKLKWRRVEHEQPDEFVSLDITSTEPEEPADEPAGGDRTL
jgi:amphi-Trp domain-containing protein